MNKKLRRLRRANKAKAFPVTVSVGFDVGVGVVNSSDRLKLTMSRTQAAMVIRTLVDALGGMGADSDSEPEIWINVMKLGDGDVTLNLTGKAGGGTV